MKYHYEIGATRWFRWKGMGDPRGYVPRPGWHASADMIDFHPITGKQLPRTQWWACETYIQAKPDAVSGRRHEAASQRHQAGGTINTHQRARKSSKSST